MRQRASSAVFGSHLAILGLGAIMERQRCCECATYWFFWSESGQLMCDSLLQQKPPPAPNLLCPLISVSPLPTRGDPQVHFGTIKVFAPWLSFPTTHISFKQGLISRLPAINSCTPATKTVLKVWGLKWKSKKAFSKRANLTASSNCRSCRCREMRCP